MKLTQPTYEIMFTAMKAVVEHCGGVTAVRTHYTEKDLSSTRMLWDLWHVAQRNLQFEDSHPGFEQKHWTRITPCVKGFNLYGDPTTKDSHIETALRKIGKELKLL